jgi:two-component system chemotaxis response regulator CheY
MAYTILIVDDSDTIRAVVQRTLKMTKLPIDRIIEASDGAQAIEKLKESWIDIVFTDIHMPRMNGLELVDTMHGNPDLRDIPVVVISTEGSSTRIEELRSKGIRGYLRKPFTPESIRDIIVETLGGWNE